MSMTRKFCVLLAIVASATVAGSPAIAQNIRGSATGPTTAKGYDHPDQFIHLQAGGSQNVTVPAGYTYRVARDNQNLYIVVLRFDE